MVPPLRRSLQFREACQGKSGNPAGTPPGTPFYHMRTRLLTSFDDSRADFFGKPFYGPFPR